MTKHRSIPLSDGILVYMHPLRDRECAALAPFCVEQEPDGPPLGYIYRHLPMTGALLCLEEWFGPESTAIDDDKMSFRFRLLLTCTQGELPMGQPLQSGGPRIVGHYVMDICDFRGGLTHDFYSVTDRDQADAEAPGDCPLSSAQLAEFIQSLMGLVGISARARNSRGGVDSFFRTNESALCVYGVRQGEAFERYFESEEDFSAFVCQLEDEIGPKIRATQKDAVLARIARELEDEWQSRRERDTLLARE